MKTLLAAAIIGAVLLTYLIAGASGPSDPKLIDLSGDGKIEYNDFQILVDHWNQIVGTPEPCQRWVGFATPLISYNVQGTAVTSSGGYYVGDASSSWGRTVQAGGAIDARVCQSP